MPELAEDVKLIAYGEGVKALGDGKIGGYLVRFSTPSDPDLTGEFFTKETEFGPNTNPPLFYHHGMDGTLKSRIIGSGAWKIDDIGLWYEAQIAMRDDYERMIYQMVEDGMLGYSSGALAHLGEREDLGKAVWIKTWIIGEASLTPSPAEPRNIVMPLKSLSEPLPLVPPTPEVTAEADQARHDEPESKANPQILEADQSAMEEPTMENITLTEEQLKALLVGAAEEALKAMPAEKKEPVSVSVTKDEADKPFVTAGEFFKAVKLAGMYPSREDPRLRSLKASGMSEGVPADGGYLVPEQTAAGIIERMVEGGAILSRISNDPVAGNTMTYNGIDETTHVGSLYGGITAYWLAEAGSFTATKPKFYQVELKLKKLGAFCYATDEQLEDITALEGWLTRTVPNVLRFQLESAIISGDGVGKPLGITASPCLVSQVRLDANEVNPDDFAAMWARRWLGANDYVWLVNAGVTPSMNMFAVGTLPVYMPQGSMVGVPYATLYGAPVIETEHCAAFKSAGDVLLCSLSQYQAISKGGVQTASSIHVKFDTDETAFRFVQRFDGSPLWHSAVTPENGNTFSPFVSLAAASS